LPRLRPSLFFVQCVVLSSCPFLFPFLLSRCSLEGLFNLFVVWGLLPPCRSSRPLVTFGPLVLWSPLDLRFFASWTTDRIWIGFNRAPAVQECVASVAACNENYENRTEDTWCLSHSALSPPITDHAPHVANGQRASEPESPRVCVARHGEEMARFQRCAALRVLR
jgi:hypothetical protein